MANEITVYQGDTALITVTVRDSEGSIVDLTAYTGRFTVKESVSDADSKALIGPITGTISTPTSGIIDFLLASTGTGTSTDINPGTYVYDVQINNSTTDVKTVVKSSFIVEADVTKTVS